MRTEKQLTTMSDRELEEEAQRRGESMHDAVYHLAYNEEDDEEDLPEPVGIVCDGPCTTCIVREVAQAMWPALMELARREVRAEMAVAA